MMMPNRSVIIGMFWKSCVANGKSLAILENTELSEILNVNKTQLNAWLKKAVDENKVNKLSQPVRYQKAECRFGA